MTTPRHPRKPRVSEAAIVRSILAYLNQRPNTYARKVHGTRNMLGWPDIIACHRGVFLALEVKAPDGKPSPLQLAELRKWERAGAVAIIVTSREQVADILDQIGRNS